MPSKPALSALSAALCFSLSSCLVLGEDFSDVEQAVYDADARNAGIDFDLKGKGDQLIFSVEEIGNDISPIDVFRVVAISARELKDTPFSEVIFAYQGTPRSKVPGEAFATLGAEYGIQNPAYTMRTWPEQVLTLSGEAMYEPHYGGLLVVAGEQMKDFGAWHKHWYFDEVLAEVMAEREKLQPKSYANDEAF